MPHWISGDIEDDSGITNGLGVLDTMLVQNGMPQDLDLHLERLVYDCEHVLRCACPDVRDKIMHASSASTGTARLRIVITGGDTGKPLGLPTQPNILISLKPVTIETKPLACLIVPDYPRIAGCRLENSKRTDYARNFAARQDALNAGYDDAIMLDTAGNIACGTTANIFIVENGTRITPPLRCGVVAGITRRKLLDTGAREEIITPARLLNADSVFLTNAVMGLRSVSRINDASFTGL
jgi:branched-subunit amino acid aminotransferase/4-amino-4-deoxychorismate lyase